MRHVPPHRFADLEAGRLAGGARDRALGHAAECERCAAAHERVVRAREALVEQRDHEPPELRWEHIGARIHWAVSSERNAAVRRTRRHRVWRLTAFAAAGIAAGAAGLVAALLVRGAEPGSRRSATVEPAPGREPAPAPRPSITAPAPAAPLAGVVMLARGDVEVAGQPVSFARPLGAGDRLVVGDGRIAAQLGAGSGFSLGPHTTATLTAFDEQHVEIAVDGTIDVTLSRRRPDQTFVVVAGARRVEVRGTVFRVVHSPDALEVACTEGHVAVLGDGPEIAVSAGERLRIIGDAIAAAAPIPAAELAGLERSLAVPLLPVWTDATAAESTSAVLQLDAQPGAAVAVDGVEVGVGPMWVRVLPGRHHVGGEWIDLPAGAVRAAALPRPPRAARRRPQVDAALDGEPRFRHCLAPLAKQGLVEGSYIVLDIGIGRDGRQGHLNVIDTNMPDDVARCLRNVVDQIDFPPGGAETVRKRLTF